MNTYSEERQLSLTVTCWSPTFTYKEKLSIPTVLFLPSLNEFSFARWKIAVFPTPASPNKITLKRGPFSTFRAAIALRLSLPDTGIKRFQQGRETGSCCTARCLQFHSPVFGKNQENMQKFKLTWTISCVREEFYFLLATCMQTLPGRGTFPNSLLYGMHNLSLRKSELQILGPANSKHHGRRGGCSSVQNRAGWRSRCRQDLHISEVWHQ